PPRRRCSWWWRRSPWSGSAGCPRSSLKRFSSVPEGLQVLAEELRRRLGGLGDVRLLVVQVGVAFRVQPDQLLGLVEAFERLLGAFGRVEAVDHAVHDERRG